MIQTYFEMFEASVIENNEDIFQKKENSPEWNEIKQWMITKKIGSTETLNKKYAKMSKDIKIMNVSSANSNGSLANLAYYASYYNIFTNQLNIDANIFFAFPTEEKLTGIWRLPSVNSNLLRT